MSTGVYEADKLYKVLNYKEAKGGPRSTSFSVKGGTVDFCIGEEKPVTIDDLVCHPGDDNLKGAIILDFYEYISFKTNSGAITSLTIKGLNLEEVA